MPSKTMSVPDASSKRARGASKGRHVVAMRRARSSPIQRKLYKTTDHSVGVALHPADFAPPQRGGGWGPFGEAFVRMNERALAALDTYPELSARDDGLALRLVPGGRAGAVPLRAAHTGQIAGGLLVEPRFGWSGVGRVLSEVGWNTALEFLDYPLVPGSGREVPPWLIAGPVLARLEELLHSLRPGYRMAEETLLKPRGHIRWNAYVAESLVRGRWSSVPCRFPELTKDPRIKSMIRWTLERLCSTLIGVATSDPLAQRLTLAAKQLLDLVADVAPRMPVRDDMSLLLGSAGLYGHAMLRGLEAIGWIADERGLGGGRELDGLAWQLPLENLWEAYVESVYRTEARSTGADVRVGRLGQTVFPLHWTDSTHRSLGHLIPDIVVRRGDVIKIVDAKYKAHLAELDEHAWERFADTTRESHRADLHQVLAYAALYDAREVTAVLVYPLRRGTFEALASRGRDRSNADLLHGGRLLRIELRGLPFGGVR